MGIRYPNRASIVQVGVVGSVIRCCPRGLIDATCGQDGQGDYILFAINYSVLCPVLCLLFPGQQASENSLNTPERNGGKANLYWCDYDRKTSRKYGNEYLWSMPIFSDEAH